MFPSYQAEYKATAQVRYDCNLLQTAGLYQFVKILPLYKEGVLFSKNTSAELHFSVNDPEIIVLSLQLNRFLSYSCKHQTTYSCPEGQTNCAYFNDIFQAGIFDQDILANAPKRSQLKIKQKAGPKAMEFNGSNLQVNMYVFSTEDVPFSSTPFYDGSRTDFKFKVTGTIKLFVESGCDLEFFKRDSSPNEQNPNLNLILGKSVADYNVQPFKQQDNCYYSWTYQLTILKIDGLNDQRDFLQQLESSPDWIGSMPSDLGSMSGMTVTFKTKTNQYIGNSYAAFVTGTLITNDPTQLPYQVTYELIRLQVTSPTFVTTPKFSVKNTPPRIKSLKDNFTVYFGQSKSLDLGIPIDSESVRLTTSLVRFNCTIPGQQAKLGNFANIVLEIQVAEDTSDNVCIAAIDLSDNAPDGPLITSIKVKIIIVAQRFNLVEASVLAPSFSLTKDSPVATSAFITSDGLVTVTFDKDITISQDIYNLTSENDGLKYFKLTMLPNPINLDELGFETQSQRRLTAYDPYAFKWTIVKAKEIKQINFDFLFDHPEIISLYASDQVEIKYVQSPYITGISNTTSIRFDPKIITLPRQQRRGEASTTKMIGSVVGMTMRVFVSSNLLLTIFSSILIAYLWGMINGLQIIAMTCLFKVRLPNNVLVVNVEILKIAAFDLFHTSDLYQKIFQFTDTPSYSTIFEQTELTGSNFIIGIGPMFLAMAFYPVFLLARTIVLRVFKDKEGWRSKVYNWFEPQNREATITRFVLEGNLDILIWAIISTAYVRQTSSIGQTFSDGLSNVFGWCMLIVLVYAPFHTLYRVQWLQKQSTRDTSEMTEEERKKHHEEKEHVQEIFEEFKPSLWSLLFFPLFILRRMTLVFTLMFLPNYGLFQIAIHILMSFAMLIYVMEVRPYKNETLNRQEFINEVFILFTSYYMLLFTDVIPESQQFGSWDISIKTFLGRTMLGTLILYILIHLGIMIGSLCVHCQAGKRKKTILGLLKRRNELRERIAKRAQRSVIPVVPQEPVNEQDRLEQLVFELNNILPSKRRLYIPQPIDDDSSIWLPHEEMPVKSESKPKNPQVRFNLDNLEEEKQPRKRQKTAGQMKCQQEDQSYWVSEEQLEREKRSPYTSNFDEEQKRPRRQEQRPTSFHEDRHRQHSPLKAAWREETKQLPRQSSCHEDRLQSRTQLQPRNQQTGWVEEIQQSSRNRSRQTAMHSGNTNQTIRFVPPNIRMSQTWIEAAYDKTDHDITRLEHSRTGSDAKLLPDDAQLEQDNFAFLRKKSKYLPFPWDDMMRSKSDPLYTSEEEPDHKPEQPQPQQTEEVSPKLLEFWTQIVNKSLVHKNAKPDSKQEQENVESLWLLGQEVVEAVLGKRMGQLIENKRKEEHDKVYSEMLRELYQ